METLSERKPNRSRFVVGPLQSGRASFWNGVDACA